MSTKVAKPLDIHQRLHSAVVELQAAAKLYDELEVPQFAGRCRQLVGEVRQVVEADKQRTGSST